MSTDPTHADVIVVGGGNAGLCAAASAAQQGADVLLLEAAPERRRGGNSALTKNLRFAYDGLDELRDFAPSGWPAAIPESVRRYPSLRFAEEILTDEHLPHERALVHDIAAASHDTARWLLDLGHRWEVKPTILPGGMPIRLEGGGPALVDRHHLAIRELGVTVHYLTTASGVRIEDGRVTGVTARSGDHETELTARSVVLACGGFQGSPQLRRDLIGPAWEQVRLRGVPYNDGAAIRLAQQAGGALGGALGATHTTPQSADIPPWVLPGDQTQSQSGSRYAYPFGITVDRHGRRFIDEGSNFGNHTYAQVGGAILERAGGTAFQIFDARAAAAGIFRSSYADAKGTYAVANSLAALAEELGIDRVGLETTIEGYNRCAHDGEVRIAGPDDRRALDLEPPKSGWAVRIDRSPFFGFAVTGGLTFTFGGVATDATGRVLTDGADVVPGLYAAGEAIGGIFRGRYPGGAGLLSGAVIGRRAGAAAAAHR